MSRRATTTRGRAIRKQGFTLIEVLLSMLLMSVLLAALWSLLGMYSRGLEGSSRRADEVQLVRAWLQQLTDDLTQAIGVGEMATNAASDGPTAKGQPLGRLLGDDTSLSIDVGRVDSVVRAARTYEPARVGRAGADRGADDKDLDRAASGLRRVMYTLAEVRRFRGDTHHSGVAIAVRREASWLASQRPVDELGRDATPSGPGAPSELYLNELRGISPGELRLVHAEIGADAADDRNARQTSASDSDATAERNSSASLDPDRLEDESTAFVPEIESMRFRYFDGQAWTSVWDSQVRKRLPSLVEVTLRLRQSASRRPGAQGEDARGRSLSTDRFDDQAQRQRDREDALRARPNDGLPNSRQHPERGVEARPGEWRALIATLTALPPRSDAQHGAEIQPAKREGMPLRSRP